METLDQALGVDRRVQGERVGGGVGGDVKQFKFVVVNGKPRALELPTDELRELGEREVNARRRHRRASLLIGRPCEKGPILGDRPWPLGRDQQRVDNGCPSGARLDDYRVQVPCSQHVTEIDSKPGDAGSGDPRARRSESRG